MRFNTFFSSLISTGVGAAIFLGWIEPPQTAAPQGLKPHPDVQRMLEAANPFKKGSEERLAQYTAALKRARELKDRVGEGKSIGCIGDVWRIREGTER